MNQPNLPTGGPPVRILIVDDHPTTAHTLARAVSQLGSTVDVISATSGREALERVQGSAADILITDMIMPEMNGLELVEKLQHHPGGRPNHIILITAYDVPGLKESCRRMKVDEIIVKPVRPERICEIVQDLVTKWSHTPSPAASPAEKAVATTRIFKLLIADDRPDNVTLLSRYLENEGYEFVTATDGQETIDQTRKYLPDLILLDINMPKKDGFQVLEEIRADPETKHIPVIILTAARMNPMDVQSGLNLGADDYVTKPFDRRELMARIRTKLRVKDAEDNMLRRNRELSMLLEVTGLLSTREQIGTVLDDVLKLMVSRLGASKGCILNFPTTTSLLYPEMAGTLDPLAIKEVLQKLPRSMGAVIDRIPENEMWRDVLGDQALSAIFVPMYDRLGALLGVILLSHAAFAYFTQEQLAILQAIANQTAVAMENAAWYAALHERAVPSGIQI